MKITRKLAELQTKLEETGLSFEEAQKAGEYALISAINDTSSFENAMKVIDAIMVQGSYIESCFGWMHTPEGTSYWIEIARKQKH